MKSIHLNLKQISVLFFCTLPLIYQGFFHSNKPINPKGIQAANTCKCYSPNNALTPTTINFNNVVPGDVLTPGQPQMDCFAWQEFISLNWPVNTTKGFGDPGDLSPVQWETYMPKDVLFQKNGVAPPDWGTLVSEQYAIKFKTQRLLMSKTKTKLLTFSAKFDSSDTIDNFSVHQAAPFGVPNWLGAQNGTNVWYEIMLNKDYYDFIVSTQYYNAITQHDSVKAGVPIQFPQGQYNGNVGAIELKAAWMEVPNPSSSQWQRYKLSTATVLDATTNKLRTTTVALVGLHILHKTESQPTWAWATFEQIDNAYNAIDPYTHPYGYNFYAQNCQNKNVTYKTAKGKDTTVIVTCRPNTSPPYYLKKAPPVPIQITRANAIDANNAAPINQMMQANIKSFYPNSVWQYYQLVDVIWSSTPRPQPTTPIQAPFSLTSSGMTSGSAIVANTTLESYVQKTNTCTSCHQFSTIAPYPGDTINNSVFGDFSFVIGDAQYPVNPKVSKSLTKKKRK